MYLYLTTFFERKKLKLSLSNFNHSLALIIPRWETKAVSPYHSSPHRRLLNLWFVTNKSYKASACNGQRGCAELGATELSKFPAKQAGPYQEAALRPKHTFHPITERIGSRFLVISSLWTTLQAPIALNSPRCVLHVSCLLAART